MHQKPWYIFLLLYMIWLPLPALAQSGIRINAYFEKDTVSITAGHTFSNKLHIQNNGNSPIKLVKLQPKNEGELIAIPDTINILPHQKRVFPVKYLSSGKNIHSGLQKFSASFQATHAGSNTSVDCAFFARLDSDEQLFMQLLDPVTYVDQQTGLLSFRLRVINKGYTTTAVKIAVQENNENLNFSTRQHQLNLDAGTDTLLRFEARNIIKKNSHKDMVIYLTMENSAGKIVANKQVSAIIVSSTKEFATLTRPLPENSLELLYTTVDNHSYQYMLRGNGNVKTTTNTQLQYNLNANFYTAIKGYDIRDTYINFEHKNVAFKAGTIAESLEMPVYGRGVKATGIVDKSRVSLYYVNNAYLLYSNLNGPFLTNAPNTWAGTYSYQYHNNSLLEASYIRQYDAVQKLQTNLMNTSGRLQLNKNNTIDFITGYSWESSKLTLQNKQGYAGGLNYNGYFKGLEISLNNFLSSAYYSGLRRGSIQLNEQIGYNASEKVKLLAKFTQQQTKPEYVGYSAFLSNYNNISTYELAAFIKLSPQLLVSLRPYIQQQRIDNLQFQPNLTGSISSGSERIAMDVRYNFSAAHTLSIYSDYGTLFNRQLNSRQNSFRLNLNYYGRNFGLNGFMQAGPYYLIDQYYLIYNQYNTNYSLSPYINLSLLKHKLSINLSNNLNYSKSSFNPFNSSYSGLAKMKVPGNWELSAQVYYTRYHDFDRRQMQLGISKNFSLAADGNHKLELMFFDDQNANGVQDHDEKPANGIRVSVDNSIAQSNDKGKVIYNNTSAGWHQVLIVDGKGWNSSINSNINIKMNTKLAIPLTKNCLLTGHIQPVKQKYQQKIAMLEGIRITATDKQNHNYFTLTDDEGNFSLYLPTNQYTIHTEANSDHYAITNATQQITITTLKTEPVIFTLIDKSQKVEVKKF